MPQTSDFPSKNRPKQSAPIKKMFKLTAFQMSQKLNYKNFASKEAVLLMLLKKLTVIILFTVIIFFLLNKVVIGILGFEAKPYLIGFLIAALMLFSLVFCINNVVSTLYYSNDNQLLLSFPVSHNQVFLSKLLYFWFIELYKSLTFYLPILIAFGMVADLGGLYFLTIPVFAALATLIPPLLAAALSFPFMQLVRLIKSNSIVAIAFFTAVLALLVFGLTRFSLSLGQEISFLGAYNAIYNAAVTLFKDITKYSYIPQLMVNLMFKTNVLYSAGILLAIITAAVVILTLAVKPLYFKMSISGSEHRNKKLAERRVKRIRQPKKNKGGAMGIAAFIKKDLLILLRSPNILFSFFLFIFLLPYILAATNIFLGTIKVREIGDNLIFTANFLLIMLIAMSSNSYSATAISREGSIFYLTKSAPLSFKVQAHAKIFVNAIISTPLILASSIVVVIFTKVTALEGILMFVATALLNLGHILWSFQFDLENPQLDWYNSTEAAVDNKNSSQSILLGLILAIFFSLLFALELFLEYTVLMWIKIIILSALFAAVRYYLLKIRLNHCFNRIEM